MMRAPSPDLQATHDDNSSIAPHLFTHQSEIRLTATRILVMDFDTTFQEDDALPNVIFPISMSRK